MLKQNVELICKQCQSVFITCKSIAKTKKYCSWECRNLSKKGKLPWNKGIPRWWISPTEFKKGHIPANKYLVEKGCLDCGKEFKPRDAKSIYCTTACKYNARKGIAAWNKGIPMSDEAKFLMSRLRIGIRLNTGRTHFKKGLIPWNYKGGITGENQLIKGGAQYKKWRADVFRRDGWSCVVCLYRSCKRGDIEADHIKPFSLFPELRTDISNGRTLCVPCHKDTKSYKNAHMRREDFISG